MTDYMVDRTALLPKIDLQEPLSVIGKSTKEAMLSGAVIGYKGLVKGILLSIFDELGEDNIPVIATGGYSKLISSDIEEIVEVNENHTLEGLRIIAALNIQDENR
jgi:type III pantothenate kinase